MDMGKPIMKRKTGMEKAHNTNLRFERGNQEYTV